MGRGQEERGLGRDVIRQGAPGFAYCQRDAHLLFNPKKRRRAIEAVVAFKPPSRRLNSKHCNRFELWSVVISTRADSAVYSFPVTRFSVASMVLEERTAHDDCKEHPSSPRVGGA